MLTPPLVEPVTVMASNVLVPMFVPVAPPAARGRRRRCRDGDRAGGGEVDGAGVVEQDAGRVVGDREVADVERPGRAVELETGLRPVRADRVDDVDVVDRAAAGVARGAGDAAAGALRVDVEAAHLVAVVEIDHVGVVVGDRRLLAASAPCSVSEPTISVAASPISFWFALRLIAGGVAGGRVVAVVDEDRVARGGRVSAWASVSNGFSDVPLLPCASSLLTYQTQPLIAIVTRPVSVPGVGPGPAAFWSETV